MKTMKRICLSLGLLLPLHPQTVRILFDGSMNGAINLKGCSCPSSPRSGLSKRAAFIQEYRTAHPGEVLAVSTGDFIGFDDDGKSSETILKAIASVKYDAIALGDQEFLQGDSFAAKMAKQAPILAANLVVDGWLSDTRYPSSVIRAASGMKIAFVGVIGSNAFPGFTEKSRKLREKLKITAPLTAVREQLSALAGKADAVILLTHQGLDADKALAKSLEGSAVRLILGGHDQSLTTKPLSVGGIPILHAGPSGNWEVEIPLTFEKAKTKLGAVKYHFFKYVPKEGKPIPRSVILGAEPWSFETVIHENAPDDPVIEALFKELGS